MRAIKEFLISYQHLMAMAGLEADRLPDVIKLEKDVFIDLIKRLLCAVHVDEEWYLRDNADVEAAIAAGTFRSAKHHFVQDGYFEGRRPCPVKVDDEWYKREYPDIAEAIELGDIGSAQEHFEAFGHREGRLPYRTS